MDDRNIERIVGIMGYVYHKLEPRQCAPWRDPEKILKSGVALCDGYARVMQYLCEKEGFKTRRVHIFMKNHPRGRGSSKIDTHTMLEVFLGGKWQLFDPTTNTYFSGHSTEELKEKPTLSKEALKGRKFDKRWKERRYDLYATDEAFEMCYRIEREGRVKRMFYKLFSSTFFNRGSSP